MALEILEHIKEAEQRAEQATLEAQQSAREMVDRAEKACRDREREGEAKSRALYRQLLEERRTAAQQQIDQQQAELARAREDKLAAVQRLLPQAADLIVQRILNHGRC